MTLIMASFPEDSPPVLAADCLESNWGTDKLDTSALPNAREEMKDQGIGGHFELVRKMYILRPNLVIMYAGNSFGAEVFLKALSSALAQNTYSPEELFDLLDKTWDSLDPQNARVLQETTLIGVVAGDTGVTAWCRGAVQAKKLSRLGITFCAGDGVKYLQKDSGFKTSPEKISGDRRIFTPEILSQFRMITLCQKFVADECLNPVDISDTKTHHPLLYSFGGFMEFCFFCSRRKRFLLANNLLTLYWYSDYEYFRKNGEAQYFFGHAPRTKEESMDDFSLTNLRYEENGFLVEKYKNVKKTQRGHLMKREEFRVKTFIDSLQDIAPESDGKFVTNVCDVVNDLRSDRNGRCLYPDYNLFKKMIQISPARKGHYALILNSYAREVMSPVIKDFMTRREHNRRMAA